MDPYVKHVHDSFNLANRFSSNVNSEICAMEGYSGWKTRHLYNNICKLVVSPDRKTEFLEVGSWKGSTIVASLFGNESSTHGTCIDNWSEFGGPVDEFKANLQKFNVNPTVIEGDFFKWDPASLGHKVDIYLFDGTHTYDNHYRGMTHMWPALNDKCIIIVDDWNWSYVRDGTLDAIRDMNCKIIEKFEVTHTNDDSHTPMYQIPGKNGGVTLSHAYTEFWNGCVVFVIEK